MFRLLTLDLGNLEDGQDREDAEEQHDDQGDPAAAPTTTSSSTTLGV